jgi:hypothetical protein
LFAKVRALFESELKFFKNADLQIAMAPTEAVSVIAGKIRGLESR